MLTIQELYILKNEVKNDPSGIGLRGLPILDDVYNKLIFLPIIDNPEPQNYIIIYNATNSKSSEMFVTKFLNLITFQEIVNIKTDSLGNIMYDRMLALESQGAKINVSQIEVIQAVEYCFVSGYISGQTKDKLIGTLQILDPEWKPQIIGQSRSQELFGQQIKYLDIVKAMEL